MVLVYGCCSVLCVRSRVVKVMQSPNKSPTLKRKIMLSRCRMISAGNCTVLMVGIIYCQCKFFSEYKYCYYKFIVSIYLSIRNLFLPRRDSVFMYVFVNCKTTGCVSFVRDYTAGNSLIVRVQCSTGILTIIATLSSRLQKNFRLRFL